MLELLGRGADPACLVRRLQRGGQRTGQVVALAGVVRALGRRAGAGRRGEVGGDRGVQPHPLPRQQVGEHRFPQQRVPEPEAAVVGDHQQVVVHRLGQRRLQLAGGQPSDGGHQLVPHPPPGHRGDPQHLLGGVRSLLDPGQQDVGERGRQRLAAAARGEQLLGVERVALGARDDVLDRLLGHPTLGAGEPADEVPDLGVRQRRELQPLDAREPHQLGEQRPQRMPTVQVVGAVGRHDHDRLVDQPGQQVAEQVAAGPVGPVHVLQHDRAAGRPPPARRSAPPPTRTAAAGRRPPAGGLPGSAADAPGRRRPAGRARPTGRRAARTARGWPPPWAPARDRRRPGAADRRTAGRAGRRRRGRRSAR